MRHRSRTGFVPVVLVLLVLAPIPAAGMTIATLAGTEADQATADAAFIAPGLAAHLEEVAADAPVRVMVQASGNFTRAAAASLDAGLVPETSLERIGIAVGVGTPAAIRQLAADPRVSRLDWADEPLAFASDTSHTATRAVPVHEGAIDLDGDEVLDGFRGAGIGVAIVDSGTDGTHPMFADAANGGSRVKRNVKLACSDAAPVLYGAVTGGDVRDAFGPFSACAVDATVINDTDSPSAGGHGTHVTGIATGNVVTDTAGRELRGAAPDAEIFAVSTGAFLSIYAGSLGLFWVLENHADPCGDGTCAPIKVVNNSWGPVGGGTFSETAPQVLIQRELVAEGVTVVWAAGNDGGDGSDAVTNAYSQDPSPGVLSVANYDDGDAGARDNALASTSSRGLDGDPDTYPDLSAPGSSITSACRLYLTVCGTGFDTADPDYNTISGTSMAAPHVAGYVAVLQQVAFEQSGAFLSPGAMETLLVDTAHPFGTSRTYEPDTRNPAAATGTSFDAGHGLVDLLVAVERLTGQAASVPEPGECPVDARFTDPSGDATAVIGVGTPLPSEPGLDIVEGWLTSDAETSDTTFNWKVADLPESPGGTEGNGEYFDMEFSLGGAAYYVQAIRTITGGERYTLGRFTPTRQTLADGLPGSFDPGTDEITVTLPAGLVAEHVPGAPVLAPGEELSGLSLTARRQIVLVVPDADTASGTCSYLIGAEVEEELNEAPVITDVSATPVRGGVARAGQPVVLGASANDPDRDHLDYSWDFGDGATGTGALVEHAYASAGTYVATVTVSDGQAQVSATVEVVVRGRPDRGRP